MYNPLFVPNTNTLHLKLEEEFPISFQAYFELELRLKCHNDNMKLLVSSTISVPNMNTQIKNVRVRVTSDNINLRLFYLDR